MIIAGRDPGQPPVALRVYLNPHVDLELTDETARAYAAADEQAAHGEPAPTTPDHQAAADGLTQRISPSRTTVVGDSPAARATRCEARWPGWI